MQNLALSLEQEKIKNKIFGDSSCALEGLRLSRNPLRLFMFISRNCLRESDNYDFEFSFLPNSLQSEPHLLMILYPDCFLSPHTLSSIKPQSLNIKTFKTRSQSSIFQYQTSTSPIFVAPLPLAPLKLEKRENKKTKNEKGELLLRFVEPNTPVL
jgi:hypothetical protein